jgi:hypothetical protein
VTTIRPNVFPQQAPLGGQRDDAAKLAAQRAFFNAAMGQAQAPAAPAAAAPVETPQAVNRVAQAAPAEAPQKVLRPGSLLDIRV